MIALSNLLSIAGLRDWQGLVVALTFVQCARWGLDSLGLRPPGALANWLLGGLSTLDLLRGHQRDALRETLIALAVTLPCLLPAHLYWVLLRDASWSVHWGRLSLDAIASELLIAALPEEFFFRAFLLYALLNAPRKLRPAAALLMQSAVFALFHLLVMPSPWRLSVAVPGLLFGLLAFWRRGIGAAFLSHLVCNLYARQLVLGQ